MRNANFSFGITFNSTIRLYIYSKYRGFIKCLYVLILSDNPLKKSVVYII